MLAKRKCGCGNEIFIIEIRKLILNGIPDYYSNDKYILIRIIERLVLKLLVLILLLQFIVHFLLPSTSHILIIIFKDGRTCLTYLFDLKHARGYRNTNNFVKMIYLNFSKLKLDYSLCSHRKYN